MPAESEASAVVELGLGFRGNAHARTRGQRGSGESRERGTPELRQQAAASEVAGDGRNRGSRRRHHQMRRGTRERGEERVSTRGSVRSVARPV